MKSPIFEPLSPEISLLKIPFAGIWVGVYLVCRSRNILIDSGLNAEGVDQYLVPALAEKGLTVSDLDLVLATHTHGDHLGGHARLAELGVKNFGCPAFAADKMRNPLKYNKLIRAAFPQDSAPPAKKLDGVEPSVLFDEGAVFDDLEVIFTPGHDSDTVCWFDRRDGLLLAGDSIQGNGTDTQGCALYMDLPGYRSSLEKLLRFPIRKIVMGHPFHPWLETMPEGESAISEELKRLDEYGDFLHSLPVGTTLQQASVALIRHLGGIVPEKLFLAMYTVREHLGK